MTGPVNCPALWQQQLTAVAGALELEQQLGRSITRSVADLHYVVLFVRFERQLQQQRPLDQQQSAGSAGKSLAAGLQLVCNSRVSRTQARAMQ